MYRIYVERKPGFDAEAARIRSEINGFLGIDGVTGVRYLNRYDIENTSEEVSRLASARIFSEPQGDVVSQSVEIPEGATVVLWEYLPGQYDQRADSAEQCLSLLRESVRGSVAVGTEPPRVRCAKMVILEGRVSAADVEKIRKYLVNPVDSRIASAEVPATLAMKADDPADIPTVDGFNALSREALDSYRAKMGLAMDLADIEFLQNYFRGEGRDPTETEIRVLDTYWSDHCRHTTFNTVLRDIKIAGGPYEKLFRRSLGSYRDMHAELYESRSDRPLTLMDMATIGGKWLRKHGLLDDMEVSAENNACSIVIDVEFRTGEPSEKWLLMFKNETHNHPTEIEPFGGAATCIGGAIRDPLSGRSWVYQSMRVTGAGDPTQPLSATLHGKLPQLKIVREAAQGFSSYGNQIGLTTGQVAEYYHPGFLAKRMELGAVIAAAPVDMVMREEPEPGDAIILLGGGTGRDGIGGATGSSKVHTEKSVTTAAAEVQKGNAVEERKIQRLFRNPEVSRMIRRCNDFGAGGVSVAVGELAPGLLIDLDKVPKKYEGLNGTELAISESQERMAVVVRKGDVDGFIAAAAAENLNAVVVADVTGTDRLVMTWRGKKIVDLSRAFLDSAGAVHEADALIESPADVRESPLVNPLESVRGALGGNPTAEDVRAAFTADLSDLACCSERGLCERFDGSIGSSSVLFPFGGSRQGTPEAGMAAKIPVLPPREAATASLMSHGFDPRVAEWSPWHGAQTAVLSSLAKIAAMGGDVSKCRLSFQEFFGRAVDERTWGFPAAALLGSVDAQRATGCASIGGKDSMSGTFENLNVPHTLVSFAVATERAENVRPGSFVRGGDGVFLVSVPYSAELEPDWEAFRRNAAALHGLNRAGKIRAMYPVGAGGIAEAVAKMAFGNGVGCRIDEIPVSATARGFSGGSAGGAADLFTPLYGSILVEADEGLDSDGGFAAGTVVRIGSTQDKAAISLSACGAVPSADVPLADLEKAWEGTLSGVFPPVSGAKPVEIPAWAEAAHPSLDAARRTFTVAEPAKARPRVVVPVFPGTNCEFDMARAFSIAGADAKVLVFRNRTPRDLEESLAALREEIGAAQILALSGGFSAGDEPDGSGKFIANVLREGRVSEAVMGLLEGRKGLVLGICNGFQALIKTGLVPFGRIVDADADSPTLTFNRLGRHVSRVVRTRLASAASPWAMDPTVLDPRPHYVPVSHGEGRVVMGAELARRLFEAGQVFSQYCDESGRPAAAEPDNPNGSAFAIEGLTSPDGRVLGKMGHSERTIGTDGQGRSLDLVKNIAGDVSSNPLGNSCQNIFAAGVRYFA